MNLSGRLGAMVLCAGGGYGAAELEQAGRTGLAVLAFIAAMLVAISWITKDAREAWDDWRS